MSLIARDALFGNPERSGAGISPDGTRLAWVAPVEGVLNVWVQTIGADDARPITHDRDRGVHHYMFAPDGEHVLYVQDENGDENWRLFDVSLLTGQVRQLTPFDKVRVIPLAAEPGITDRILFLMNQDDPQLHDVYELDLPSGTHRKVVENPGFLGFVADTELRVRAAMAITPVGGGAILVRDGEEQWRPLLMIDPVDTLTTQPMGFDREGRRLLLKTSQGANATRLLWIDVTTGEQEVVAADERYDIASALQERETRRVRMYAVYRDRLHWYGLDAVATDELEALSRVDDGDLVAVSADAAERLCVLTYAHPDAPARTYLYDRETGQARFLFTDRPRLENKRLAPVTPFRFTARDGLELHGYLTFPVDDGRATDERATGERLPTVVLEHGGPWTRDTWTFDPTVQWLASRGYLVVQVNYRGSTGYGKQFTAAGDREWAGASRTDTLDAVDEVVALGYADPAHIGVFGGSWGGYRVLLGATFSPDVFACGVSLAGPSNLVTLMRNPPEHWAPQMPLAYARIGNPATEESLLWEHSPLSRAEQVRIPLLIAQGANDPRVPVAEARQFVDALRARDIPVQYLVFENEGHNLTMPANRLQFFRRAELFLADVLGGAYDPQDGVGD